MKCERCGTTDDVRAFRNAAFKKHYMCMACIGKGLRDKHPEIAGEVLMYFEEFTKPSAIGPGLSK